MKQRPTAKHEELDRGVVVKLVCTGVGQGGAHRGGAKASWRPCTGAARTGAGQGRVATTHGGDVHWSGAKATRRPRTRVACTRATTHSRPISVCRTGWLEPDLVARLKEKVRAWLAHERGSEEGEGTPDREMVAAGQDPATSKERRHERGR
jgi:hypothetical protein